MLNDFDAEFLEGMQRALAQSVPVELTLSERLFLIALVREYAHPWTDQATSLVERLRAHNEDVHS